MLGLKNLHCPDDHRNSGTQLAGALLGSFAQRSKHEKPDCHVVAAESCHHGGLPLPLGNSGCILLGPRTVQVHPALALPIRHSTENR
ncbi:hypothetical protein Mapa_002621 [Marchantia paleacea]|nr:hypothetical protein Mapa_002621 [Marchantia paleacea]